MDIVGEVLPSNDDSTGISAPDKGPKIRSSNDGNSHMETAANALSFNTHQKDRSLETPPRVSQPIQSCFVTECGVVGDIDIFFIDPVRSYANFPKGSCPSGFGAAEEIQHHGCSKHASRLYCCPENNMPTCQWRGSGPTCNGKCKSNESPVTFATGGCVSGHKNLCCTNTDSDKALSQCGKYCDHVLS